MYKRTLTNATTLVWRWTLYHFLMEGFVFSASVFFLFCSFFKERDWIQVAWREEVVVWWIRERDKERMMLIEMLCIVHNTSASGAAAHGMQNLHVFVRLVFLFLLLTCV